MLGVKIINIVNNLMVNSKAVLLNYVYANSIVGELVIRIKTPTSPIFHPYNFLVDLVLAENIPEFHQTILVYINKLAEEGKIYTTNIDTEKYNERGQKIFDHY